MKLIFQILAILFSTLIFSQTKSEKINFILKTTGSIEGYKSILIDFTINPLKNEVDKKDSLKLEKIISKLTDEEISKRLSKGYSEVFSEKEIDEIYLFMNTSGGKKLFNSNEILEQKIINNFKDIENEISQISEKSKSFQENNLEKQVKATVYADREDGFYEVIKYDNQKSELKDLKLSAKPVVTSKDFLEVKKDIDQLNRFVINIILTFEGAKKFKELTANNIGKPIAIVMKKELITAPIVTEEISRGELQISGNFTIEEVNAIIQRFKK